MQYMCTTGSTCSDATPSTPGGYLFVQVNPGDLLTNTVDPTVRPPAESPHPPLKASEVVEPPLPAVTKVSDTGALVAAPAIPPSQSAAWTNVASLGITLVASILVSSAL